MLTASFKRGHLALTTLEGNERRGPAELHAGKKPEQMNIAFRAGTGGLRPAEN